MKIRLHCPICATEGVKDFWQEMRPLGDNTLYEVNCPNGHTTEIVSGGFKYDTLFEIGLNALKNGFHREAASSFATSLERFYEYSIGVLLMHKFSPQTPGRFDEEALKAFDKLWKTALKLSERQLGAFCALYFNEFSEIPLLLDEAFVKGLRLSILKNPVNFRNRVVHEGYIPTYDEAFQYGEAVFKYMSVLLNKYKEQDVKNGAIRGIDRSFSMHFFERAMIFVKRGQPVKEVKWSLGIPQTFISANTSFHSNPISLADYLDTLETI